MTQTRSVLIYGPTKIGKTLDICNAFKTKTKLPFVLLAEPDGLASVESNLGWVPPHHELTNLNDPFSEAIQAIDQKVSPMAKRGLCSAVIIDTGSELASRLLDAHAQYKTDNPLKLYPVIGRQFRILIRKILTMGVWCGMTCHESEPRDNELSGFRRGGPRLPGSLVEEIPSQFSLILRAGVELDTSGTQEVSLEEGDEIGLGAVEVKYRRVYRCEQLHPRWIMGDRYSVAQPIQEMDLRPLLFRILNQGQPVPQFPPKQIRQQGK